MKPGSEQARDAGCTCSIKSLPTKNFPYTPKNFILYQPDCPINGHGIFKRAGVKKKTPQPVNFKIPSAEYVNIDLTTLLS